MAERLNRLLTGRANYFTLGQVGPAYGAVDRHAARRLRQRLCRMHKVRSGKIVRFSDESRMFGAARCPVSQRVSTVSSQQGIDQALSA